MQPSKWLAGLAPCIILLFILSLSVVDVESKRGRRRQRFGKHGNRHGGGAAGGGRPPPSGGSGSTGGQETGSRGGIIVPVDRTDANSCPTTAPFGDVKGNISELWKEVNHLSNPIHIHVHRGRATGDHHHSPHCPSRHSPHGHQYSHGPSGKNYHPHSPGGKRHHHRHSHGHGRRGTPGGKRHHTHHQTPGGKSGKGHHHHSPGGKSGKQRPKPHSPGNNVKPTPEGKDPGHSHTECHTCHPSHETHIHVHIALDTEEDKFEEFMEKHFDDYEYARCDLIAPGKGSPVTGTVVMRQMFREPIEVKVNISGMAAYRPVGMAADHNCEHGLHVHKFADFSQGCTSFGPHFNPKNTTHGSENDHESHAGDWGNIECDKDGNCEASMNITNSELLGPYSIIGRGIVLHELKDDLGEGGNTGSLKTGNAGKRIACCGIVRTGPPSDGDW